MTTAKEVGVRRAQPGDAGAIASVHIESSQDAYAPLAKEWPAPDRASREAQWLRRLQTDDEDPTRIDLVAELAGSVVAFVSAGSARRKDEGAEVEIYVIHVLPRHRGKRIGSVLWLKASEHVRGQTLLPMYVETLAELRCCSFYEAHGGQAARRNPRIFHGGAVTDVVYIWPFGHSSEVRAATVGDSYTED